MAALQAIDGLDPKEYGTDPIYYLCPEYSADNAYDDQDAQWVNSWYVRTDWELAGLLTDFSFRHHPGDYAQPNRRTIGWIRVVFLATPVCAPLLCWALFTGPTDLESIGGESGVIHAAGSVLQTEL